MQPRALSFAVLNHKGGSCKSTTAVNLAGAMAERGLRALVIDLDPQGAASYWLCGEGPHRTTPGTGVSARVIATAAPGVDLLPASPADEARADSGAGLEEDGWAFSAGDLSSLLEQGPWDVAIADCPPTLGARTRLALAVTRELLVPVEAHVLAVRGLAQLFTAMVRLDCGPRAGGHTVRVVACRVDRRKRLSGEVLEILRARLGPQLLQTVIRENVQLAEAPSFHAPITRYAPGSPGASDYRKLAEELLAAHGRGAPE